MLAQLLTAETDELKVKVPDGRDRVMRHCHGPQRAIQNGVGRSRSGAPRRATADVAAGEKIHLTDPAEVSAADQGPDQIRKASDRGKKRPSREKAPAKAAAF